MTLREKRKVKKAYDAEFDELENPPTIHVEETALHETLKKINQNTTVVLIRLTLYCPIVLSLMERGNMRCDSEYH
jgi:hypothetical protein